MSRGRGSVNGMSIVVALLCLLVHSASIYAKTFTVGDEAGWTFDVVNWPRGKTFNALDVLEFYYSPELHNVVEVDIDGYNSCKAPSGAIVHTTGRDRITLARGTNSFICTFAGHCGRGVKISVTTN